MLISWSRPIAECIDCLSLRRGAGHRGNRNIHNNGLLEHHEQKVDEPREKQEKPWIGRIRHQSGGVNGKDGAPKQEADKMDCAMEKVALNLPFSFVPHNRGEKVKVERFLFVSRGWVLPFKGRAFLRKHLQRDGVKAQWC